LSSLKRTLSSDASQSSFESKWELENLTFKSKFTITKVYHFALPRWKNPTIRSCTILTRSYKNLLQDLVWSYKSVWKSYLILYDFIRPPQSHHFWHNRTIRFLYDLSARSYTILSGSYRILQRLLRDCAADFGLLRLLCASFHTKVFYLKSCIYLFIITTKITEETRKIRFDPYNGSS